MPRDDFRRRTPLSPPTPADFNKLAGLARNTAGQPFVAEGPQNLEGLIPRTPLSGGQRNPGRWARITSGSNPYSWVGLAEDASDGVLIDDPDGDEGTDTAYAVRESTTVPVDTVVWLELSADHTFYWFDEVLAGVFVGDVVVGGDLDITGDLTVSGDVLLPFSGAKATRSTAQTLTNNTLTAIVFDGQAFDTDDYWDSGTGSRLTVPTAGYYATGCYVSIGPSAGLPLATDPFAMEARILPNGTLNSIAFAGIKLVAQNAGVVGSVVSPTNIALLDAGDYVELHCKTVDEANPGAPKTGNVAASVNLWIYRLGT